MSAMMVMTPVDQLEQRLSRGADWLVERERRGELDGEYGRWLTRWLEWLAEYERLMSDR